MKIPSFPSWRHCSILSAVVFTLSGFVLIQSLSAQSTWHFIGPDAGDLNDRRLWNSQVNGQGDRLPEFNSRDTFLFSSRVRVVGDPPSYVFPYKLTSGGLAEVDPRARQQAPTFHHVVIPQDTVLLSEPRVEGTNLLTIKQLELWSSFRLRGYPGRPFEVSIGQLRGYGMLLAGDSVTGSEEATIRLSISDGSDFTGVVRFRNVTGGFSGNTDISRAELFIQQADDPSKTTTFTVSYNVTVRELRLHGYLHTLPGTYTAADLTQLLTGQCITFVDDGGRIIIAP